MSRTDSPASASALRVPPVEINSTPNCGQRPGQFDQAGLVADAQQSPANETKSHARANLAIRDRKRFAIAIVLLWGF